MNATDVPVLAYYQYLSPEGTSVYTTRYFCGSCRQELKSSYSFPSFPEKLEEENEERGFKFTDRDGQSLSYYAFCPWCGVEFADEWWKDKTIQNERTIDHYDCPGTHKGDTHEFRGDGPDCINNHWLAVSGGDKICWCEPEVEPGIMGCVIRHQAKSQKDYDDYLAEMRSLPSPYDDYYEDEDE